MITEETKRILFTYDADANRLEMNIDNTSLEHFTTCARAAEYRLVDGREGTTNMAAKRYGGAKHIYLEQRLLGADVDIAERYMASAYADFVPDDPDEWRTTSHAIDSVRAYERHWAGLPLVPITVAERPLVELPFRLPLCDIALPHLPEDMDGLVADYHRMPIGEGGPETLRVYWTGRIDAIVNHLGEAYVCDHKTTSMVGPSFYDDFKLSSQTLGYTWASRHIFRDLTIRGLLLNVLIGRKVTKSGVAHAFDRQTFIYSDAHLEEWHRNTQVLVSDFIAHLLRGYFPMQTKWCQGKFGTCQYHTVCTSLPGASRSIVLNSGLYQDVTWSPLAPRH